VTAHTFKSSARTSADAREGRVALGRRLAAWHCDNVADALLVFSELVTNAVVHAGGATAITVVHGDRTLRVEVHDDTHGVPSRHAPEGGVGGYGLNIVARLSREWGWDQTARGKVVWANVLCCSDEV
jgi:anti-sigma regulatory factor (Ser/Thr protein kinase)